MRRFMQHSQIQEPCDDIRLPQPRIKCGKQRIIYRNIKRSCTTNTDCIVQRFEHWPFVREKWNEMKRSYTDLFIFRFVSLLRHATQLTDPFMHFSSQNMSTSYFAVGSIYFLATNLWYRRNRTLLSREEKSLRRTVMSLLGHTHTVQIR